MLYEGKRYEFRTKDGDLLVGTIEDIVPGRVLLIDVDVLSSMGTTDYLQMITLYGEDVSTITDYKTGERIY